jgi:hypothetical protein
MLCSRFPKQISLIYNQFDINDNPSRLLDFPNKYLMFNDDLTLDSSGYKIEEAPSFQRQFESENIFDRNNLENLYIIIDKIIENAKNTNN